MKKNKKIILFTILLLLFNTNVYASCTEEEINGFKKIEDEYKITYEFNKETKDYIITFISPKPELYDFEFLGTGDDVKYENNNKYSISNVEPGKYDIFISGTTETCTDTLKSQVLTLPKYNIYSEDPICQGIEEFVLCQSTYDKDIDYETFVSRVNTYKKSLEKKENNTIIDEQNENKIVNYIKNNILQIIVVAIFIILTTITILLTTKSIKKSRRLE